MITPGSISDPETPQTGPRYHVSVLVPVAERPAPLDAIYAAHSSALEEFGYRCEFIFAVEPGFHSLAEGLEALKESGHPIQLVYPGQVVGESALLKIGCGLARGSVVLTLPPYWRIVPGDLPRVIEPVATGESDIVMARRWPRRDSWLNRLQNRVYHAMLQPLGGTRVNDVACGVRAMRRETLMDLPLFGDFHRFLPLIALREGFQVLEVEAEQHPDDQRARVYSPGVYVRRIIDILGIHFLLRFTEKPLRFFGLIGSSISLAGLLVLIFLAVDRLQGQPISDRPLLLLGSLLLVLGVQAIALGLVGEIIVHLTAPDRKPYRLIRRGTGPIWGVGEHASPPTPSPREETPRAAATPRAP